MRKGPGKLQTELKKEIKTRQAKAKFESCL